MKTRILLTLLVVPMFAGCMASYVFDPDPNSIAAKIVVKKDSFKKQTEFVGPDCISKPPCNFVLDFNDEVMFDKLFLRAYKDDETGYVSYEIYVKESYDGDWRFYHSAYDSDGNRLDMLVISRDVETCSSYGNCRFSEHIVIDVSKEYLENHRDSSIRFKLYAQSGHKAIFFVPPTYIQAFLSVTQSLQN